MDVRISGGKYRGRKIYIPNHSTDFRPTKSMVKEAVCSSLHPYIAKARVCELCGGSGAVSFDLLSRGAESARVIEQDPRRSQLIAETAQALGLQNSVSVECRDVKDFLAGITDREYDIVFFDPPYYDENLSQLLPEILSVFSPASVIVYEYALDDSFVEGVSDSVTGRKLKKKKFGKTGLMYFTRKRRNDA
ncbi:MAG: RsmD family RNA methyltransferase [Fibrobacterota bacterium]